jgi:hypothetical protein
VVNAGNFHILHMKYKHTWQDLEADEHSRRDHILGDIHNSPHSIDSAPVETGTRNPAKNFDYFLSNRIGSRSLQIGTDNTCLFAGLRPHESLMF